MAPTHRELAKLVDEYLDDRLDRRRFIKRAIGLGLSLGAASSLLAACGGRGNGETSATSTPQATTAPQAATTSGGGGTLRLRTSTDIVSLDPAFGATQADVFVYSSVQEGLLGFKAGTWEAVNQLAETFEPSSDQTEFAFTLKQGMPFHRGYGEVTAEDVKYSFERIAGLTMPNIESPYSGDWQALEQVKVTGKYSGVIVLKEPFAPLLKTTIPAYAGYVVSKKAVEELGEEFATNPVGSGPYEFVSWTPNQELVMRRFADWGGASTGMAPPPAWDEIRLVPIPEPSSADIALETGEVDLGELAPPSVSRFQGNSDFTVEERVSLSYSWIALNMQHPKLQDIKVRQAIRYGIDVPSIIEAGFEGLYQQASAPLSPSYDIGYWEDAPIYSRDVEKAKDLLSQAEVSGLELTITLLEGEIGGQELGEVVQANLAEVGIKINVVTADSATYWTIGNDALSERELTYVTYLSNPDPYWVMEWFTCAQINEYNWMFWCNQQFDELNAAALIEADPAKRSTTYLQMQELWDTACHTVWIVWPTTYVAARKGLTVVLRPDGQAIPPWTTSPI